MPIIDADGIFNGDRLQGLSRDARLFYPYFLALANGYGRFEINTSIIVRKFMHFPDGPTIADVKSMLNEYRQSHLLFLYKSSSGKMWGQWDTPVRLLPNYKSAADKRSPAPPEIEYKQWLQIYQDLKHQDELGELPTPEQESSEISEEVAVAKQTSSPDKGIGIGVGVGIGIGEGIGVGSPPPQKTIHNSNGFPQPKHLTEYVTEYPLKTHLDRVGMSYSAVIETPEHHADLMAGLARYKASSKWRDQNGDLDFSSICSPAKFIDERRYNDWPPPWEPKKKSTNLDRQAEIIERKERERATNRGN